MKSRDRTARSTRLLLTALVVIVTLYLAWAIWDHQAFIRWMESARPLPYFLAMAVLPAIGIPLTPLFLLAGVTFDLWAAMLGSALALAANLVLCYYIGRSRLRRRLVAAFHRFGYELPDFAVEHDRSSLRRTLGTAALVKLTPGVPGFIKNYGLGAARVPFAIYFAVGMAASGAYGAILILFGDSLFDHRLSPVLIVLLVAAVAVVVVKRLARRSQRSS